ncbi:hypothetical protein PR048_032824 [Dryococelus australis]|uniref:Uncharacterized protein n=1 Tax=Dryococelus australis TaxID=614101 RepID=A0ABQ9G3B3_9NEOP|nr:hypothetical protein PR048_032824 [Dryococelus australis]
MKGLGKRENPEKTRPPTASSDTILTCEHPLTRPGIEPGSPRWEASALTARPPRPRVERACTDGNRKEFANTAKHIQLYDKQSQEMRHARLPPRRSGLNAQPGHNGCSQAGIVQDNAVSRGSPTPPSRRCSIFTSIDLIVSQDRAGTKSLAGMEALQPTEAGVSTRAARQRCQLQRPPGLSTSCADRAPGDLLLTDAPTLLHRPTSCPRVGETSRSNHAASAALGGRRGLVVRQPSPLPPRRTGFDFPIGIAPRFTHVGILPDDAAGRWVSSWISRFPSPFIPALLHTHLTSPSSALETLVLRAVQIPQLTRPDTHASENGVASGHHVEPQRLMSHQSGVRETLDSNPGYQAKQVEEYPWEFCLQGLINNHNTASSDRLLYRFQCINPFTPKSTHELSKQEFQEQGKREVPEKTRRPTASSVTIPSCENPGSAQPGIERGSPYRWVVICLTNTPPRPSK